MGNLYRYTMCNRISKQELGQWHWRSRKMSPLSLASAMVVPAQSCVVACRRTCFGSVGSTGGMFSRASRKGCSKQCGKRCLAQSMIPNHSDWLWPVVRLQPLHCDCDKKG